jgi:Uma2 family endonuclease
MSDSGRLLTAAELERFPDDDYRYELVDGRLVRMSPTGWEHGRIVMRIGVLLGAHLRDRDLGAVVSEVGFKLHSNPDTVRGPDIAFVRQERLPAGKLRGFWNGPPDLAIEVLSPEDRPNDIHDKMEEYLSSGVLAVVVVDPGDTSVTTYRRLSSPVTAREGDELDLDDVVEGFRCRASEIFE